MRGMVPPRRRQEAGRLNPSLAADLDALDFLSFLSFWESYGQQTVLEVCRNVFPVDCVRQPNRALETAVTALFKWYCFSFSSRDSRVSPLTVSTSS